MKVKKISAYEAGKVRLEEYEIGRPQAGEVLVKTLYSTISPGTELAWINHLENTPGQYPYDPGYSCCGIIEELGEGVEEFMPGDIVVCNNIHCSAFITGADRCTKVPEPVSPLEASAFRLASISLQGVRKADIQIGDRVAVLGLGAIGNFAAQLAYVAGACEVIAFDFVEWRRKIAEAGGLVKTAENGEDDLWQNAFDVVIEATGVPQVVNTALGMVKPLGRVILLGSTRGCTDHVNFYRDVHRKGIQIIGAHEMHRAQNERDGFGHFRTNKCDEEAIIALLAQKRIRLLDLISEEADPENAQSIYDRLFSRKEKLLLAAFRWNGAE